ncbi:tRNA nucleotidyltransferase (CCA-adding enzyme) [Malonomonas rubra DSM 5091]|uniref:tRNA nucleotidyltransferase (CCA-adding enzyme) n=1 Tax=Malonomonas rubra DSM 5091 TaxID=1122189 RepID=A0A1M6DM84_MALRU|nr:CBS domain-containing protein [Malonomonas rubra]SHI74263.1 tRNA nucleotidyltransferase (CCA-adding enzyme) [Malonomonas rubra DSM 5091]
MDVIATHVNADFDCLGSMIAAKRLYPDAVLVFPGGQERGLRDFLLQSTLYAYGVKGVRDIDLQQISRLILVDVRSSARIGRLAEIVDKPGLEIHIYDHHPADEKTITGQFELIEEVGATTTILAHQFMQRGIAPTADEATMMMLGLYEDTGHLLFASTTPRDYQAAAFLLENGANLNTVADFLVREMSPEQIDLLNELLKSCKRKLINGVEVAIAYASIDYYVGDISSLVHKLKDIENLNVLIVAVRMEDRVFLVGRSQIPEVHVGELFQRFGGGGHAYASSATVKDIPLVQLLDLLEEELQKTVQSGYEARQLMSAPVKTLPISATIEDARELMTRFNFNAIPVLNAQHLVGIITRQVVEKAAHHKLQKMPVTEVMTTDFDTADPQTQLAELQRGIIDHNQRCIPVVEHGELVGIVTRTDLLRHLLGDRQKLAERLPVESGRGGARLKRKNLARLIDAQLPKFIRALLRQLGEVADTLDMKIYLVGGFVRDLLLRQENLDIDVVVEGDGIAFAEAFAKTAECRIRSHQKFGTAVIVLPDGFKIDVASARIEYYESPAALPQVEHSSIRHDLYRRDFTINTLTISLNEESYGQLLDFFGGQRDLKEKQIRVLHNLSLIEDPTRLFRAVRFEQRLGFRIGRQTERLMRGAVRMKLVKKVGGARIRNELRQILDEPQVISALRRLEQFDLLKFIDPHLHFDRTTAQMIVSAEKTSSWFDLLYTGEKYHRWLLYLFCLLNFLSDKGLQRVSAWLDLAPKYRDLLLQLPPARKALKRAYYRAGSGNAPKNSDIYHWFNGLSLEIVLFVMAGSDNEQVRKWVSQYVTDFRKVKVLLDGNGLIELGLKPGPHFHQVFLTLLNARLNGEIRTLEDERQLVREKFVAVKK